MKFEINDVVFDSQNKETVKITNGIRIGAELVPTEALAVRVVSIGPDTKPTLGLTYRKVNAEFLSETGQSNDFFKLLFSTEKSHALHFDFIGRI